MAKKKVAGGPKLVKVKEMGNEMPKAILWTNAKKAAQKLFDEEAEAEKNLEKLLPKACEALEIVKRYEQKMKGVVGKIGAPPKAQMTLTGALARIRRGLAGQIDILTDAL